MVHSANGHRTRMGGNGRAPPAPYTNALAPPSIRLEPPLDSVDFFAHGFEDVRQDQDAAIRRSASFTDRKCDFGHVHLGSSRDWDTRRVATETRGFVLRLRIPAIVNSWSGRS
jgi:hypothetical protein